MKSRLSIYLFTYLFRLFSAGRLSLFVGAALSVGFATTSYAGGGHHHGAPEVQEENFERGAHNGRLLQEGEFALEMTIFEQGVAPEFRIYPTLNGTPISPSDVSLKVDLVRLGDGTDNINFSAENDYLRGDMEVYEPHSFKVVVSARYQGKSYKFEYDNFEGRTHIHDTMAQKLGIETDVVGARAFSDTVNVYGKLTIPPQSIRHVSARFPGEIKTVHAALGDKVKKGQLLMTVESNESLQTYQIKSPIDGVITEQDVGVGEQAIEQTLLTIINLDTLIAELSVFPMDANKVVVGAPVSIRPTQGRNPMQSRETERLAVQAKVFDVLPQVNAQQAFVYRVNVPNTDGKLRAGQFVAAEIGVGEYTVPMAVKTAGLQRFRDFTVVYAKVGEAYEVRMLTLGRQSGEWTEVLGGIKPGTEYVTENSYIIKADIDKSGAAHDH